MSSAELDLATSNVTDAVTDLSLIVLLSARFLMAELDIDVKIPGVFLVLLWWLIACFKPIAFFKDGWWKIYLVCLPK